MSGAGGSGRRRFRAVVTTVQPPTPAARTLAERVSDAGGGLVVIGDRKGPSAYDLPSTDFYPLEDQHDLPFGVAGLLPTGHYARKNLGYLVAMADGAEVIYETDDDNEPLPAWGRRSRTVEARPATGAGWTNAYRAFTDEHIWPRGFPLDRVGPAPGRRPLLETGPAEVASSIQQGLADGSPDVDAVWRLVLDRPFRFERAPSVFLPIGCWCPFNSQSTWWWPPAYPLLYLPSHCSFRMTDIWRSLVAQRCLWALGEGVVFHAPEVVQERNEHDLMRDFEEEVPGHLLNRRIRELLEPLDLEPGEAAVGANLEACYRTLVEEGILPEEEMELVEAWTDDVGRMPD